MEDKKPNSEDGEPQDNLTADYADHADAATSHAADVLRRFERSWVNFNGRYRALADRWTVYDNSGDAPRLVGQSV